MRQTLVRRAKVVLGEAGALVTLSVSVHTFSHALGTVRLGDDARNAPLDANGRFRGLENLYLTDGSALPTSEGVNPSLTIAAVALRTGCLLAGLHPLTGARNRALPRHLARRVPSPRKPFVRWFPSAPRPFGRQFPLGRWFLTAPRPLVRWFPSTPRPLVR